MKPCVLTIAGSDPSGGAGIQADLRVFAALDINGLSAITAITVQNSLGVISVSPIVPEVLTAQIEGILDDSDVRAVKIGMLAGAAQVRAVAAILRRYRPPNVVLDPVLASTGGVPLLDREGLEALKVELIPLCDVITPNLPEACVLAGLDEDESVLGPRLIALGANAVLITGGHSAPEMPLYDTLYTRDKPALQAAGKWVLTEHTHGTGCIHSSAVAAYLACGTTLQDAAQFGKLVVERALAAPIVAGRGRGYPGVYPGQAAVERKRPVSGIYMVTDPTLCEDISVQETVQYALAGGASVIQMRQKSLTTPQLVRLARELRELTAAAGALFIVNDRVDVAMASEADGVHLGPDDMDPEDARRIMGPDVLIGVSVSSVAEAGRLAPFASYFGVGAIFGSSTKADAGEAIGIERIREIKAAFPGHPIVAIGGINASNIESVWEACADSAAVISAILAAADIRQATANLVATHKGK